MKTKKELEERINELAEDILYEHTRYKEQCAYTEYLEGVIDNLYTEYTDYSTTTTVH